ncbi:uncharacterized protein LOC143254476 [Tachypleus tridentatus]|uniref:uncharacterized protein LOC143254476 n=1 Tax=Tachypleus tridentatus TaxID=6853 RepID=UPI003FD5B922
MLEHGQIQRRVAQRVGVSPSVINQLWRRYRDTNCDGRRPGQGRHRCTTAREGRYIMTTALRDRLAMVRSLRNDFQHFTGTRVSTQTVPNRLQKGRLRARRPARSVILTAWELRQWATVQWTDESRFTVSRDDERARA